MFFSLQVSSLACAHPENVARELTESELPESEAIEYQLKMQEAKRFRQQANALTEAIQKKDIKTVQQLLEEGVGEYYKPFSYSFHSVPAPLIVAVESESKELVDLLLRFGAYIDTTDSDRGDISPLMMAVEKGNLEIATLLLERKANVNISARNSIYPLILAAYMGNPELVRLLLQYGASINEYSFYYYHEVEEKEVNFLERHRGHTALHFACQNGHAEVAKILLEKGADIEANSHMYTPLMLAVSEGHLDIAKLLLDNGAKPNVSLVTGKTPLMMASEKGDVDMIALLLKRRAHINARTPSDLDIPQNNYTALHFAEENGHLKAIELLCQYGAVSDFTTRKLTNKFLLAIKTGNIEQMQALLDQGLDINAISLEKTGQNENALMLAAQDLNIDLIQFLLKNGADIHAKDIHGCNALAYAFLSYMDTRKKIKQTNSHNIDELTFSVFHAVVKELLQAGANINDTFAPDKSFFLVLAMRSNDVPFFDLIMQSGVRVDMPIRGSSKKYWQTPLHIAIKMGNIYFVKELIKQYANINKVGEDEKSPLRIAIQNKQSEIAKLLIEEGARTHVNGYYPILLEAIMYGEKEVADVLLEKNSTLEDKRYVIRLAIDKNIKNVFDFIPYEKDTYQDKCTSESLLEYAIKNGRSFYVKELIALGEDVNPTPYSFSPLELAIAFKNFEAGKILIENGADINRSDNRMGRTALMTACQNNRLKFVQLLLDNGALVNIKDNEGKTALDYARETARNAETNTFSERLRKEDVATAYKIIDLVKKHMELQMYSFTKN